MNHIDFRTQDLLERCRKYKAKIAESAKPTQSGALPKGAERGIELVSIRLSSLLSRLPEEYRKEFESVF
jgi:hypothetical protein